MPVIDSRSLPAEAKPHIAAAGRVLAQATAMLNAMTPEEIAAAAYTPSGPSKDQLVALARARQAQGSRAQLGVAS